MRRRCLTVAPISWIWMTALRFFESCLVSDSLNFLRPLAYETPSDPKAIRFAQWSTMMDKTQDATEIATKTFVGKVEKIISAGGQYSSEKAQISVEGAEDLYGEIRSQKRAAG